MLLLGPFIPEMKTFQGAFFTTHSMNLMDLPAFREMLLHQNLIYFPVFAFFVNCMSNFGMVIFVALTVYLFNKAVVLEKSIAVET